MLGKNKTFEQRIFGMLPDLDPELVEDQLSRPETGEIWRVELRGPKGKTWRVSLRVMSGIQQCQLSDDSEYGVPAVPCYFPNGSVTFVPLRNFIKKIEADDATKTVET